tara:strand:+ start:85 stop:1722 length:1638 start_codon:yes stop_codon:yes gene_type:complete
VAPPTYAPNINTSAAQGIQGAMAGATREMGYTPPTVQGTDYSSRDAQAQGYGATHAGAQGYDASQTGSQGYNATQAGSQGFDAAGVGSRGYGATSLSGSPTVSARDVTAGQLSSTDLSQYYNPYENQVVQSTLSDLDRSRQMAMGQAGAQATAAGAFGGSRQALMEAETNKAFAEQAARSAGQLRQAGFNQAQGMAQQDIAGRMQAGLANQGANLQAGTTTANLAQQAGLSNQAAINQASQFGASAANQAAAQGSAQQQAASQFGASAANQAALQNAAAGNQASQFGASAANQAAMANMGAANQASQFGAAAANQAAMQNAAASNQANQFGASAGNQASMANAAAQNQAAQFAAQQNMSAQLANQNAGLSGSAQRLGAAGQLGQLANVGFGMGQTVNQNLAQQGIMQQAMQQQLIDAAKGQFQGYQQAPYQSIGLLSQALGASPIPQSQTTSKTPGLFDYLTLGASMSDARLKENVTSIGTLPNGLGLYSWDWTNEAKEKGLSNHMTAGVIAQEVQAVMPDLVELQPSGYLAVHYGKLIQDMHYV